MLKKFISTKSLSNLDLRNVQSKKSYITKLYQTYVKSHRLRVILFSLLTSGLYLVCLKRSVKNRFYKQLAEKKIFTYQLLHNKIEGLRSSITYTSPKSGIQKIYKAIMSDEENSSLFNLYSKCELLLFISCPFEDEDMLKICLSDPKRRNYYKDWHYIKQSSRSDEIESIKKINAYYGTLKNRFLLTKEDVNKRLKRASISKDSPTNLTLLKVVTSAFEEMVTSYIDFTSLKKSNFQAFEAFSMVLDVHLEVNLNLLSYFEEEKDISVLPESSQRFLLDFLAKTKSLNKNFYEDLQKSNYLIFTEVQESLFNKLLTSQPKSTETTNPLNTEN